MTAERSVSPFPATFLTTPELDTSNGLISSYIEQSVVVLTVTTPTIDIRNSKVFQRELVERIGTSQQIVLDLHLVDFIDSSGLGVMISALRTMLGRKGDLRLAGINVRVHVLIEVTRMDRVFSILPDVESAIQSYLTVKRA